LVIFELFEEHDSQQPAHFLNEAANLRPNNPSPVLNKDTTRTESRWCLCYCLAACCDTGSVSPHASVSPSRGAGSLATGSG